MSTTPPPGGIQPYNPLRDPFLAGFISRPNVTAALRAVGKIEDGRLLIDDDKYLRKIALQEKSAAAKAQMEASARRDAAAARYAEEAKAKARAEEEARLAIVRNRQARELAKISSQRGRGDERRSTSPGAHSANSTLRLPSVTPSRGNSSMGMLSPEPAYINPHLRSPYEAAPPEGGPRRTRPYSAIDSILEQQRAERRQRALEEAAASAAGRPVTAPASGRPARDPASPSSATADADSFHSHSGGAEFEAGRSASGSGARPPRRRKKGRRARKGGARGGAPQDQPDPAPAPEDANAVPVKPNPFSGKAWHELEEEGVYDRVIGERRAQSAGPRTPTFLSPRFAVSPGLDWLAAGHRSEAAGRKLLGIGLGVGPSFSPASTRKEDPSLPPDALARSIQDKYTEIKAAEEAEKARKAQQALDREKDRRARLARSMSRHKLVQQDLGDVAALALVTEASSASVTAGAEPTAGESPPMSKSPSMIRLEEPTAIPTAPTTSAPPPAPPANGHSSAALEQMTAELEALQLESEPSFFTKAAIKELKRRIAVEKAAVEAVHNAEEDRKRQAHMARKLALQAQADAAAAARAPGRIRMQPSTADLSSATGPAASSSSPSRRATRDSSLLGGELPAVASGSSSANLAPSAALADPDAAAASMGPSLVSMVRSGDNYALEDALRNGVDVNQVGEDGRTCLLEAIAQGDLASLQLILKYRPDIAAVADDGESALHIATGVMKESVPMIQALLDAGALVNAGDARGRTPLFHAVGNGWVDTVKVLLAAGASATVQDAEGETPLARAYSIGENRIVNLLEAMGSAGGTVSREPSHPNFGAMLYDEDPEGDEAAAGGGGGGGGATSPVGTDPGSRNASTRALVDPAATATAGPPSLLQVMALGTFQGEAGELSFIKGTPIDVIATSEDGWWEGRLATGATGLFPVTFTTGNALRMSTTYECARALANYEPGAPDEIPLKKNDIIVILHKTADGWCYGRNPTGATGLLPSNYIERV